MDVAANDSDGDVADCHCGEDGEDAGAAFADLWKEDGEEGEEEEGDVEEGVDELGEGMGEVEGFGKDGLWAAVGLVFEPLEAGDDEDPSGEGGGCSGDDDATVCAQEPDGRGNHDEDAQPGDLSRRAADGVGGDGEAEPGDGGARGRGLERAEAGVETDDDGEEAVDVGHEGDREHEVERGENEGEGRDGCVALGDVATGENALQEEGEGGGDEHGAGADGGKGEAEDFDEGGGEVELPGEHGSGPAVVGDVAGGDEVLDHEYVGAVVIDAHGDEGVADELAEEDG